MAPPGEVRRDALGIPHVSAPAVLALAWWQGHAVAVDRAWQLEHARRKAAGRLAEVLGRAALSWDVLARRAGLSALGRTAYDGLDGEAQQFLSAFTDGANAGLRTARSWELDRLRLRPGAWQPWTPLAVFAAHHLLFATYPGKLWRRHLAERVPPDVAALLHAEGPGSAGSNCWVVGGARTATGFPLIGGDPHRTFEWPNAYQQVRLTCTDPGDRFDVAGFTFPGVPGVQHFAHAGSVAWGITNAMADYQDLFVEQLRRTGGVIEARGPQGWVPATAAPETVVVKDSEPVVVEVVVTANGPVVHGGPESPDDDPPLSLRTAAQAAGDLGFGALLPLLRARTSADVDAALDAWVEPVNNVLVADRAGDVRQRVAGRVPVRAEENRWRPVPGWLGEHRWRGWLEDLPRRTVAPHEHLVTANHRMDASFDRIGVEFATPARADRIATLLAGRSGLTTDDFAAVHRDVLAGRPAALLRAVLGLTGLDPAAARVQDELGTWDQRFDTGSTTATTYVAIRDDVLLRLAEAEPFVRLRGHRYGAAYDPWFDVRTQLWLSLETVLSPRGRAVLPGLDGHLAAAVTAVAAGPPRPRWGSRHRYEPPHPLGLRLADVVGEDTELAGDNDCVRCSGSAPGSRVAFRGSVARYVWDLGPRPASGWVVPLGAAGDPADPAATSQRAAYVEGVLHDVDTGSRLTADVSR